MQKRSINIPFIVAMVLIAIGTPILSDHLSEDLGVPLWAKIITPFLLLGLFHFYQVMRKKMTVHQVMREYIAIFAVLGFMAVLAAILGSLLSGE